MMVTVLVAGAPVDTPAGRRAPNPSSTSSSSSSTVSSAALRVNVFSVSPESKVTLAGTPK